MKYELLNNGRGILADRAPILNDVKGTFKVSFLLPCKGHFFAVFIDANGKKYQVKIIDSTAILPTEILQPQYVQLYVIQIESDKVVRAWDCEPLKISNLCDELKSQWEISGSMSEVSAVERLTEIERMFSVEVAAFKMQAEKYSQAIVAYNSAIEVINNLSERLAALESNYDPTVIK